jgi:hypothetical protein
MVLLQDEAVSEEMERLLVVAEPVSATREKKATGAKAEAPAKTLVRRSRDFIVVNFM